MTEHAWWQLLACPVCRSPLQAEQERLRCPACGRVYPVCDGIPVLLPDPEERSNG